MDTATAPQDYKARTATIASNPPPPPVTGVLSGSFSVALSDEAAFSSALSSLRFDVAASTTTALHYTFRQTAIYNKTLETGLSSIQMRNHLAIWVSDAGASAGHGSIQEIDNSGNIWRINLTQIHSTSGGQLLTCQAPTDHDFCVQVAQPITATVQRFHGFNAAGAPIYDAPLNTSASSLSFVWRLPTTS